MSKNSIFIVVATLFLIGSLTFDFNQKSKFGNSLKQIKNERAEIEHIASLQQLWSAKGIKSKLDKVLKLVSSNKKERFLVKRSKADIKLNALTDKELNKVLTKLAMLPVQFKKLLVTRSGEEFILECLCVW